jgi:hypothetical protein
VKIALYIEDGLEQIVLTPDTETEAGILGKLHDDSRVTSIHRGAFYGCQGGWKRRKARAHYDAFSEDESTMIVLHRKTD